MAKRKTKTVEEVIEGYAFMATQEQLLRCRKTIDTALKYRFKVGRRAKGEKATKVAEVAAS